MKASMLLILLAATPQFGNHVTGHVPTLLSQGLSSSSATTFEAAAIAGIAAVFGTIASLLTSRRTLYLTAVTAQRSKWIDQLRSSLAELVPILLQVYFMHKGDLPRNLTDENARDVLVQFGKCVSSFVLQLNPDNEIDSNIISLLLRIFEEENRNAEHADMAHDLLIRHGQWLLKTEWEKVKTEACGPISRNTVRLFRGWMRARRYRAYANGIGAVSILGPEGKALF